MRQMKHKVRGHTLRAFRWRISRREFGRFIEITTSGSIGPGDSDLLGVRLVK